VLILHRFMMFPRTIALLLAAFRVLCCASSDAFLPSGDAQRRAGQIAFLDQLEGILGLSHREATETRLEGITQALQTTFASLPQSAHETVSASSARYAIHRLFVQRHGWHVKGLAPQSGNWSTSTPALGMGGRLPQRLVDLVEEQLASDDFHLSEIAVLAATIETFIHGEVLERLRRTCDVLGVDVESTLSEQDAMMVMDTYMTAFLAGDDVSRYTIEEVHEMREDLITTYPYWVYSAKLIREMQQQVAPGLSGFVFSDILKVLEAVNERIGRRIDEGMCQDIEDRLLRIEEANGTGRVRLVDFYNTFLNEGAWQFQESAEFLRQLGVLDESDPSSTRLVIPNYLNMQANCANVSSFYDLCCIDTCEDLLRHLESRIKAPHATPEQILSLVSALPSVHVPGNRKLPAALVTKLHEVAEHHGGQVPLHGRLFAQWMHFAYPRDCPYPQVSGATKLMTHHEWFIETGVPSFATRDEMKSYVASANSSHSAGYPVASDGQSEDEGMCSSALWSPEEELVDAVSGKPPPPPPSIWPSLQAACRLCAFLAVLASAFVVMWGLVQEAFAITCGSFRGKATVDSYGGSRHV